MKTEGMTKEKTLIEKGDKLRYNGLSSERLTNGVIYEVTGLSDAGTSMYVDNLGSERYLISGIAKHFELVEESAEGGGDNMTKLKKGDFVRYLGGDPNEEHGSLTSSKVYEIVGPGIGEDPYFLDDVGDSWHIAEDCGNTHCFVKVFDELSEEVEEESIPCDHCGTVLGECAVGGSDGSAYCSNKCADEPVISDYEKKAQDFGETDAVSDAVHQPQHYTQGKFETIEIIEEITQGYSDGFVAHCAGTAIKYIARAPFKHATPLEDIRKARAYLDFAIARIEGAVGK